MGRRVGGGGWGVPGREPAGEPRRGERFHAAGWVGEAGGRRWGEGGCGAGGGGGGAVPGREPAGEPRRGERFHVAGLLVAAVVAAGEPDHGGGPAVVPDRPVVRV